jgi:hypothetical protein
MTTKDIGVDRWQINDEVLSLRVWATERSQALPTASGKEWTIGSEESAWLRLEDSQGRVSRKHASISRREGKWILRDSGSMNGVIVQGRRCVEVVLEPAQEIWLGGITMIAESGRSMVLRGFLRRLLGWGSDRARAVDLALRSLRIAAMREAALVLYGGDDDIVLLARALHRHALGADRPFVMCDPSRTQADDNVRVVRNYKKGMEALKAAKRGSLCIWDKLPPRDFVDVKRALQDPDARTTLIVCMQQPADAEALGVTPIMIPSVKRRTDDLPQIVDEYGRDAGAELGLPPADFPNEYREWIVANEATSFTNIEKAALRLLALREADGNAGRAAKLLGMGRWSLSKWIRRRSLPMDVR